MSVTIELDLPDKTAQKARKAGLLESTRVAELIERELDAEASRRDLFETLEKIRALPGEPMSAEEIQAEIDAVRAERKARREAGRSHQHAHFRTAMARRTGRLA